MKVIHNNKILRSGAPRLKVDEGELVECKIVIFLPLAGGCPETEGTKKSGRETVDGVYCYENGRAAFIRGWSTITNNVTCQSINAFNNQTGGR